ncbi:MAG: DegT/DnrJ/EryC1/StrS family aminotransferase [Candidatus Tectomicrobia bacterium]|uniref:DegT/DnrJ/EryC1/StrS family aminotransferase n=1 Tax=Tectimicrobiota bacterium TaxID=2528274 RepID=A0A932I2U9_UNCTE|nr:DegT/DnrJ/EryC1/StrS family aminotransferase [Candidatus Tectomicrobia bacterium]
MMKIPFVDLHPQYLDVKQRVDESLARIIASSSFVGGNFVKEFEAALAQEEGKRFAVGVKSGTAALQLVFEGLGLPPGAEIVTTTLTAVPTVEAIVRAGFKPVLCDIDPRTYQISAAAVEAAVTPRTAVLLPVHLYGFPAPLREISALAARKGLILAEDVAQAQGASLDGKRVGTWGEAACFSFYPSKCLGGFGDSGAAATDREELASRVRALSNHGRLEKFTHETVGVNERIDPIQAAVLSAKLPRLKEWNAMRRRAAQWYLEGLAGVGDVVLPEPPRGAEPVWHLFVIRTARREALAKHLAENGVQTGLHYPVPVHLHPAYASLGYARGAFPEAEAACDAILSLPIFPHLTETQAAYVIEQVSAFFGAGSRAASAAAGRGRTD